MNQKVVLQRDENTFSIQMKSFEIFIWKHVKNTHHFLSISQLCSHQNLNKFKILF